MAEKLTLASMCAGGVQERIDRALAKISDNILDLNTDAKKKRVLDVKITLTPSEDDIIIHYNFYEPDKQRDKGNIFSFADKVFQDALQKCGVIKNDGWKEIDNFTHDFYVDKKNPRIEIFLEEIEKGPFDG